MGDNIREIESVITKLNMYSNMLRVEITLDFVKNHLKRSNKREKKEVVNLEDVIDIVSKELNVKPSDIK